MPLHPFHEEDSLVKEPCMCMYACMYNNILEHCDLRQPSTCLITLVFFCSFQDATRF